MLLNDRSTSKPAWTVITIWTYLNHVNCIHNLELDGLESARTAISGRSLNFNLPVTTFEITDGAAVQAASVRTLVDASNAINHLHGTLGERGLVTQVAEEDEIQQVVPAFVADSTLAEAVNANPELCQFNLSLIHI